MGLFKKTKSLGNVNWKKLNSIEALEEALLASNNKPIVLFKHSTRCSISSMALNRFEQNWSDEQPVSDCYFIDLIQFRAISNSISEKTGVIHQSPQCILLHKGSVLYQASHSSISANKVQELLKEIN